MALREDAGRVSELADQIADLLRVRGIALNGAVVEAIESLSEVVLCEARSGTLRQDGSVAERTVTCPACGGTNVVVHEAGGDPVVIQDCEVCCCPIRLAFREDPHAPPDCDLA